MVYVGWYNAKVEIEYNNLILEYNDLSSNYSKLKQSYELLNETLMTWEMSKKNEYDDPNFVFAGAINGLYKGNYFCVWTKDRDYSDVMQTCNHEWMHYQYRYNWEHFDKSYTGDGE